MNAQDLFAGYDVHASAEELAAEAALEGAGFSGPVTVTSVASTGVATGVVTGFHCAGTGR
ncbi:LxmA leader domain family RiPP [Streptomyces erythrochromogenes]|uniref:LxmA leader domain family RiPP n=1 Tax=Streptomyces erythrochromogenes TaxID=285574 RepID=UPI0036AE63CB